MTTTTTAQIKVTDVLDVLRRHAEENRWCRDAEFALRRYAGIEVNSYSRYCCEVCSPGMNAEEHYAALGTRFTPEPGQPEYISVVALDGVLRKIELSSLSREDGVLAAVAELRAKFITLGPIPHFDEYVLRFQESNVRFNDRYVFAGGVVDAIVSDSNPAPDAEKLARVKAVIAVIRDMES